MTLTLRRSLALATAVLLAGCSHSNTNRSSDDVASSAAGVTKSASGTLATTGTEGVPHDSISDRADHGRIAGDSNAKVWVIMLSDFQCPYCKQWHDTFFQPIVRDYLTKNKIRLAFINMPLNIHPNAMPAAEAAMCASVQNKFWQMHDALFGSQDQWAALPDPAAKFEGLARSIPGLDAGQWRSCVSKHATAPLIQADRDRARTAGAISTPTFFVDGKMVVNSSGESAGAAADLRAEIEAALKTKR